MASQPRKRRSPYEGGELPGMLEPVGDYLERELGATS
jgi:hypothetical protein